MNMNENYDKKLRKFVEIVWTLRMHEQQMTAINKYKQKVTGRKIYGRPRKKGLDQVRDLLKDYNVIRDEVCQDFNGKLFEPQIDIAEKVYSMQVA